MKMKRVISLLLALVLLTGSVPGAVFAEETQTTEVTEETQTTEETTVPAEETEETEASDEEEETEPSEPSESEEEPEVIHEHDYEAAVTDPTCTEQGYTTYTCQCGESYVDAYVDALGHDYENGICTGCGAADPNVNVPSSDIDLFVFAGQSNMMGAAVLEPEVDTFTENAWEYKYIPRLRGAESGSFVSAQNPAGEFYYKDLTAAYGDRLYDLSYKSILTNYGANTHFCPAMRNGVKDFSAQSEADTYPSASLAPYFATEYAGYGHSSIYAHMAKGAVNIVHYFTEEMMMRYNALISEYNAQNGTSYQTLSSAGLSGAGDAFDEKYSSMLEDYADIVPEGTVNNKCFVWLQGEGDGGRSYIEYKLKMQVLWEHLQNLGFTHFFVLRVGYWGSTGILNVIKAQEDFCAENENCYIVTRAPSLIPHPGATTDNWWISEPDAEYADCRDSYVVPGSGNHHFNEKAMQIFAERSAENIHRILYQGLDPVMEEENIQGLVKEEQKTEEEQPEDTTPYTSFVGTYYFNKGLSVSTSSGRWGEKNSSTAASTDLIQVASGDSVWIQYVFYLSEAHAVGGFYDKDGNLVAPLYYKDFGFSLGGSGGTAAFLTPETTNRISIADVESATGKEIDYVRFTAWQASAGGHTNTEARIYHTYIPTVTAPTCTEQGYTTYTCGCGESYVDDYVEATGHKCENGVCTVCGYSFAGKKVSILSHSMSTYDGVSNSTSYNSTIGKNDVYYTEGRHDVYREDTWWQQTIDALGMELLVNNSWSGSCVFQPRKGAASVGYGDRAVNLHNDRTGEAPDIIFVYLGCNDFAYYQDSFGKAAEVDYAGLIRERGDGTYTYGTPTTTCEAYAIMLHKVEHRYPDAEIYCMTSTARRETDYTGDSYPDAGQPTAYSAELQKVAKYFGYPVIDLENAIPKDVEIFDKYMGDKRAHANKLGMDQITNEVLTVMQGKETEICHVICQDGTVKEQAVLLGGAYSAQVQLREGESVAVTMGGKDITDEACRNGKIAISKITGDIAVEKVIDREPLDFAWEIQNNVLVSVGSADNTATKLDGTVTDGMLNNARYQLETAVVLKHDLPWALEWQCEGDWRGCVFAEDPGKNSQGEYYLTRTVGGQLSFGFWTGKQYDNYGVDLSQLDDQRHTYRLENRIGSDGSNMVWVYVDGKEVGQMNRYYIGSKDQSKESDWVSGKDFLFPYISMDGHALRNCRLEYLKVFECVHAYEDGVCTGCGEKLSFEPMALRYDDHVDMTDKVVEIIDAGQPTSYQVGYGVEENKVSDTAVVSVRGNDLVATGIGTAKVRIDGQLYEITVTAAPISLLLLIGQSNMRGSEGNADQSIVCPDGMVYATFGDDRGDVEGIMNINNATKFAASALTGQYSTINVEGTTEHLSYYPINSLTEVGKGTFGPDSGFAYEWVKQTGEKVWVINAAHGGSAISSWQPTATNFKEAVLLFSACQETLRKEIAAGHFTLSHMGYFWCQGCSDSTMTAQQYVEKYLAMHDGLKPALTFDHDSNSSTPNVGFEFAGIIPVRAAHDYFISYREGVYTDTTTASYYESFKDLRFNGPRVAQYWMANNPDLPDIWNVCNIGEDWVWMPDGTNGVTKYFQSHYENGTVDYTTQIKQSASWYTPTTPKAVHDSIHYNQIGYNEIGRESARNALIMLGKIAAPEVEASVELLSWDGYTPVSKINASLTGNSGTLVVPKVYPVWKSKDISYSLTEGFTWSYYDILSSDESHAGTLIMENQNVTIEGHTWDAWETICEPSVQGPGQQQRYCSHCDTWESRNVDGSWQLYSLVDHLTQLPEDMCGGVNLWDVRTPDNRYFTGTGWSGSYNSITIPVNGGDKIYATSLGKAGTNGHVSISGHRITYFDNYGVLLTQGYGVTAPEFEKNGGYLVVPEGAVAINISVWDENYGNEVYILNREHQYKNNICSICHGEGPNIVHYWTEWETVVEPSAEGSGIQRRVCTECKKAEEKEIKGVWQIYDLTSHLLELPKNICCDTNLWDILPHEDVHFTSGKKWGVTSTPTTSITIPVEAGDRIYATSWNKAGENGHATSDGIRLTFFNSKGIAQTLGPGESYRLFAANGGYLVAPEGSIAVNIVMWYDSEDYEVYILNREHCYGDWEITKEVTADSEGREQKVCAGCGDVKVRRIVPVALTATVEPVKVSKGAKPEDVKIGLSASQTIDGGAVADLEMAYIITDKDGKEVTLEEALKQPGEYTITPKVKTP